MESDTPKAKLGKVIQIDETKLRGQLGELVRESVEDTLNALLEAEADELCQAKRYERTATRRSTRAGHYKRGLQTKAGEVRDTVWFTGTDTIRAIRPHVTQPNGSEYLLVGRQVDLTWEAPTTGPTPQFYSVWLDRDGGDELEELAVGLTGTQFSWVVTGPETTVGRILVQAHDGRGVMGSDISDGDFTIAAELHPPNPVKGLALEKNSADLVLSWERPDTDLLHGPASLYRIMRATSPQGPFTEIDTAVPETFTDASATGPVYFYKIVATNPAGDAAP